MTTVLAQSDRLQIVILNLTHLDRFQAIMNDPQSKVWSTSPIHTQHFTPSIARDYILSECTPTPEKPWNRRWGIVLRPQSEAEGTSEGVLIGLCGIPRRAEVGYRISSDYWGKGYMTEALKLILAVWWELDEAKTETQMRAGADTKNLGSARVLEKAGFKKGELKKEFYERSVEVDGVKVMEKGDMQFFYLDRPNLMSEVKVVDGA